MWTGMPHTLLRMLGAQQICDCSISDPWPPQLDTLMPSQRTLTGWEHSPGRRCLSCISDLAPLVGLVRGVQRPRVRQRLLAIIAAHGHQKPVRYQRQRVRIPRAWPTALHHDPGDTGKPMRLYGSGTSTNCLCCHLWPSEAYQPPAPAYAHAVRSGQGPAPSPCKAHLNSHFANAYLLLGQGVWTLGGISLEDLWHVIFFMDKSSQREVEGYRKPAD